MISLPSYQILVCLAVLPKAPVLIWHNNEQNQLGCGETPRVSSDAVIGTIFVALNTPPLNGITETPGGTITVPQGSFQGQIIVVKDEGGNALSANIIVAGAVDGGTNVVINQDYGSVTVYWDATSNQWFTI